MRFGKNLYDRIMMEPDERGGNGGGGTEDDDKGKAEGGGSEDKSYSEAYVKGIRDEAAKTRRKLREVEERLSKFDGLDPEEFKKILEEREAAKTKEMEAKGEWEKLKGEMVKAHGEELKKRETRIAELEAQVAQAKEAHKKTILAHAVTSEAAAAKAINPEIIAMMVDREAKVEELENGDMVVKFYKPDGSVRIDMKTGEPFSIKQRLEEMKMEPKTAMLFEGAKVGAGSSTNGRPGGVNPWKKETFNLTEQGRIFRENRQLAKQLAAEAGITLNV